MKSRHDGFNWLLRLEKGELLMEQLIRFIEAEKIKGGWVLCIGGAEWAELGFYDLPSKTYNWQKVTEPLEIVSLQGNIAWAEGKPALHLHGAFSKADFSTLGGHVKELEVAGTCEVFIHQWDAKQLTRSQDEVVGLKLLDL